MITDLEPQGTGYGISSYAVENELARGDYKVTIIFPRNNEYVIDEDDEVKVGVYDVIINGDALSEAVILPDRPDHDLGIIEVTNNLWDIEIKYDNPDFISFTLNWTAIEIVLYADTIPILDFSTPEYDPVEDCLLDSEGNCWSLPYYMAYGGTTYPMIYCTWPQPGGNPSYTLNIDSEGLSACTDLKFDEEHPMEIIRNEEEIPYLTSSIPPGYIFLSWQVQLSCSPEHHPFNGFSIAAGAMPPDCKSNWHTFNASLSSTAQQNIEKGRSFKYTITTPGIPNMPAGATLIVTGEPHRN